MVGCASVDAAECDKFETKRACEQAEAELGECMWLEVRAPVVNADGSCAADAPTHGECVGYNTDTNAGCGLQECGGDETRTIFFQSADDHIETFESPHCGGAPVSGDWQECAGDESTPECSCACAP